MHCYQTDPLNNWINVIGAALAAVTLQATAAALILSTVL